MHQKIETPHAPKPNGPYSQAVQSGPFAFIAGQIPLDPVTGQKPEGIEAQTRQVLKNIEAILKAAGLTWADVVRVEIFLQDLNDFKTVNEIYAEHVTGPVLPARQTVQVARLPLDARIEISCIAVRGQTARV